MNRREFLKLVAGGMLASLVKARGSSADTYMARVYLPVVLAKPKPPTYSERKGVVIIRSAGDVTMLGASWWYNYTMTPNYDAPGFVPMVRDPYQLADLRVAGWSTDLLPQGALVLFYNEPNLVEQMYGLDLTPEDVATDLHELHEARPDLHIVGPSLFYYSNWRWQHDQLIAAYETLYNQPMPIVVIAAHAIDCSVAQVVNKIEWQVSHYTEAGYDLPVWVTEYMKGSVTCWPNPETCADVCGGVWEHYANDARIERMCWFPARWSAEWSDPGGVSWLDQRLIDDNGVLTETGVVYQGLGD